MSVPIHNLYDYLYQCLEKRYTTAYFYPFGHKDIQNVVFLQGGYFPDAEYFNKNNRALLQDLNKEKRLSTNATVCKIFPPESRFIGVLNDYNDLMLFHDQEPLNYDLYENIDNEFKKQKSANRTVAETKRAQNLRWFHPSNKQKKWILVHSELNSNEVERYNQSGAFTCAYFWGHALLARDWYRYAKYDPSLKPAKLKKLFLLYVLGKTGTRTYRKQFLEELESDLKQFFQIGSFKDYEATGNSSATYDVHDFNHTGISVVLETIFDQRIHLTEKTLRPLAVGHPFILTSGPGSLKYLRSYGFKTFSPWIDESYDLETNSQKRLEKIFKELQRLSNLSELELHTVLEECRKISSHNKQVFFSDSFFNAVIDELKHNVDTAVQVQDYGYDVKFILDSRRERKVTGSPDSKYHSWIIPYMRHIRTGGTLETYVPPWEE